MRKPRTEVVTGILSGLAMLGVAATGVLSAMRAPKYQQILKECDGRKPKAFVKTYWPAIVAGVVTDVCIGASWGIGVKEIGVLTAGIGYLAANRDQILEKTKEIVGEDKVREIKKEVSKAHVANMPTCTAGPCVEETGRGDLLCFESHFGRWFRSSDADVDRVIRETKRMWDSGLPFCMSDIYHNLGISATAIGYRWGWPNSPDYDDDGHGFGMEATLVEGWDGDAEGRVINEEVLIIDIYTDPMPQWDEV